MTEPTIPRKDIYGQPGPQDKERVWEIALVTPATVTVDELREQLDRIEASQFLWSADISLVREKDPDED